MQNTLTVFVFASALAVFPVTGWTQDTGADAFAAGDYAKAQQLWSQEAASGSADALLGLGALADSGYLGTPNPQAAFGWYLTAARLGSAQAQMNVAISYDAGLGRDRNPERALLWYTRAALRGQAEAQFNLGLLFESGEGGHVNTDQARYWFDQAGIDRDVETAVQAMALAAPQIVFSNVRTDLIEAIWQAPATISPVYELEVLDAADAGTDYNAPLLSATTNGSGLLITDAVLTSDVTWRVVNRAQDGADYRTTQWQGKSGPGSPVERVTLVVDSAVPAMTKAAAIFAQDLRAAGYWVRVTPQDTDDSTVSPGTYVSYGFQSDIMLANQIARYMPGPPDGVGYVQKPGTTRPGEVIVHLAARASTPQ